VPVCSRWPYSTWTTRSWIAAQRFMRGPREFVVAHGLDDTALTFLLMADAHHTGPMDGFFATVCQTFDLATPPEQLWGQYRRRMPELASCRPESRCVDTAASGGLADRHRDQRDDRQPAREDP
jgi:hypothetical protein